MYHEYFGLNQAPYKITPDTSLFFKGGNRGAVLEALIYAITSGEGIVRLSVKSVVERPCCAGCLKLSYPKM